MGFLRLAIVTATSDRRAVCRK